MISPLIQEGAHLPDFFHDAFHQFGTGETGIDGHQQDQVGVGEVAFHGLDGGVGVDGDAEEGAAGMERVRHIAIVAVNLGMDGKDIALAHLQLGIHQVGFRYHEMAIDRETGASLHGFDEIRAEGEVGDEMRVHDIDVQHVYAQVLQGADVFFQVEQVGAHDRCGNLIVVFFHDLVYFLTKIRLFS